MRRAARSLLMLYVFSIPWEYSLDFGPPLGNIARVSGLILMAVFVLATLKAGRMRTLAAAHWAVLAFFLWLCASCFWSMDKAETLIQLRSFAQVMMPAWIAWDLIEDGDDLLHVLRAYVVGSWVLGVLTVADFLNPAIVDQVRFAPLGQDPNDVARFLDVALPFAALLVVAERRWWWKFVGWGYLVLGIPAVLMTASRGGFIAAAFAALGCMLLLLRSNARIVLGAMLAAPIAIGGAVAIVPQAVLLRLRTIPEQVFNGDLNQRLNIWRAGWDAFAHAPFWGSGAGTFVGATGLSEIDTAHNTALALGVEGGIVAVALAVCLVVVAVHATCKMRGAWRVALGTAQIVWFVTALVSTVEVNRTTWLLLAFVLIASRIGVGRAEGFESPTLFVSNAELCGETCLPGG